MSNTDQPQDQAQNGHGEGRVTPTELAQTELILDSVPEVGAFPPGWRDSPAGVQYLFRQGSVVVRDWHLARVLEVLPGILQDDRVAVRDVVAGATRISWASRDEGTTVQEVIARIDDAVGAQVAAPDHLLYVCGHSCAAIEQEVPSDAGPFPPPQVGPHAADPLCGQGDGVRVLVMDTGLVANAAADHWWLAGVTGENDHPFLPAPPGGRLTQDGGHGTFVAGCVRVTAPEAGVHVVNAAQHLVLGDGAGAIGAAFETDLAREVRRQLNAPNQVPDVLVLNFAGTTIDGRPPLAFDALYDDLLQHLKELLILSPAGNEGDTRKNWPASYAWVVSVGGLAVNWRDRASWSNHGHNVDVYAPGDRLVNAFATGTYTTTWEQPQPPEQRVFEGMALWSGTSFSTPLVAGMVAARMSTTGQSSRRAWHSLLELAERQAVPGVGPVLHPGQGCGTPKPGGCC